MRNLHRRFDRYYLGQIYGGDFTKNCGLLRIYELYLGKLIYYGILKYLGLDIIKYLDLLKYPNVLDINFHINYFYKFIIVINLFFINLFIKLSNSL